YGIRYGDHRNVGPGLGDDRRSVGDDFLVRLVGSKDRISRLLLPHGVLSLLVAVLETALVAPELLLDPLGRLFERLVRVLRLPVALENQALVDVQHDVAGERAGRPLAERHRRRQRPTEVFFGDRIEPLGRVFLKCGAGIDLVARNANFHGRGSSFESLAYPGRRLRVLTRPEGIVNPFDKGYV